MDEGQFVPVEGIRRHAKTECIKNRVICAPGLSPAGTRFLEHCGILNGHVGLLVSGRSEEHTSELQSLMRISYAVFCLKKKNNINNKKNNSLRQHTNYIDIYSKRIKE